MCIITGQLFSWCQGYVTLYGVDSGSVLSVYMTWWQVNVNGNVVREWVA